MNSSYINLSFKKKILKKYIVKENVNNFNSKELKLTINSIIGEIKRMNGYITLPQVKFIRNVYENDNVKF